MAVVQNAKTITRRSLSLKEFLRFYDDDITRREFNDLALSGVISTADPKTISTVLALNDCTLAATSVLDLLSFMDPDRIPEFMLVGIIGKLDILGIPFSNYPAYFIEESEKETYLKHIDQSATFKIALHEVFGHGTGKLLSETSEGEYNFDIAEPPLNLLTGKLIISW